MSGPRLAIRERSGQEFAPCRVASPRARGQQPRASGAVNSGRRRPTGQFESPLAGLLVWARAVMNGHAETVGRGTRFTQLTGESAPDLRDDSRISVRRGWHRALASGSPGRGAGNEHIENARWRQVAHDRDPAPAVPRRGHSASVSMMRRAAARRLGYPSQGQGRRRRCRKLEKYHGEAENRPQSSEERYHRRHLESHPVDAHVESVHGVRDCARATQRERRGSVLGSTPPRKSQPMGAASAARARAG